MLLTFRSQDIARLLPSLSKGSADEGDEGEHRMGAIGEEGLLTTIPRDQAYWTVCAFAKSGTLEMLTRDRHIDADEHRVALASTESLLKELKQLDDKIILTEVYMLESRAAHAIQNLPRAKVSQRA